MNRLLTMNTYLMAEETIYQNVCRLCPSYKICVDTCDEAEVAVKRIESAFDDLFPIVANKPYPDEG